MTGQQTPEAMRDANAGSSDRERSHALVELITTTTLAVSTVVAVTAVSIGIARAEVFGGSEHGAATSMAIALFIGTLIVTMGGLTALAARTPPRRTAQSPAPFRHDP